MKRNDSKQTWATQAAQNAVGILGDLTDPGEDIPIIRLSDMAGRISAAYPDRATYNQAVHDSHLEGEQKLWLIVP